MTRTKDRIIRYDVVPFSEVRVPGRLQVGFVVQPRCRTDCRTLRRCRTLFIAMRHSMRPHHQSLTGLLPGDPYLTLPFGLASDRSLRGPCVAPNSSRTLLRESSTARFALFGSRPIIHFSLFWANAPNHPTGPRLCPAPPTPRRPGGRGAPAPRGSGRGAVGPAARGTDQAGLGGKRCRSAKLPRVTRRGLSKHREKSARAFLSP